MTNTKLESSKFTTFIATLKLTTSHNDGEALAAIRAANRLLSQFGGDWEALLRGRVTLIADPFSAVPEAPTAPPTTRPAPPPPQQFRPAPPRPTPRPYTPPPPTPQQRAKQWRKPQGRKPNLSDLQF